MRFSRTITALFTLSTLLTAASRWHSSLAAQLPLSGPHKLETSVQVYPQGLSIDVAVPDYERETIELDGTGYDRFSLPGQNGELNRPGAPQIPVIAFLVAAPPDADAQLRVSTLPPQTLEGSFVLPPGSSPLPAGDQPTGGEMAYIQDQAAYLAPYPAPGVLARLAGEAWIRGQRVLRIEVYPLQYNASARTLTFTRQIHLQLDFTGNTGMPGCGNCRFDDELENLLAGSLLNYEQGRGWRVAAGTGAMRDRIQSPETNPFLGPRYEVLVDQDGVYHMTYADLQAAGMDVDNVNPQTFRMTNQGQDIAIYVAGEGDGSFDPGDHIAFYGQDFRGDLMAARYQATMTKPGSIRNDPTYAANNWFWQCIQGCELESYFERFTDQNIYYLLEGGAPSPRMATLNGAPGGAAVPPYYTATVRAEESNKWWAHEWYDDDVWFWDKIRSFTTRTYTTTLTAPAPGALTANLHVEISSRSGDDNNSPDHHSQLSFNGFLFEDLYWDGRARHEADAALSQSLLVSGTNTVTLTLLNDVVLPGPYMYFDFFEITYPRLFEAASDQLVFSYDQPGTWKYQVSGLVSAGVEVYDILDPMNPRRVLNPGVTGGGGDFTASFQVTHGSQAAYAVAGTGGGVRSPLSITPYFPPDFGTMPEADYILITHANMITSTQTLANYRASQGYQVAVLDIDDLYNEFNDGIPHPIAIKNFLAWTFANWSNPPTYVVLIGNGNWNMLNNGDGSESYHNAPPSYMVPNLAYIDPWQGEVDSTNLLVTLVGDDTLPDVYIGRIPVSSDAEMAVVVGKITAYETAAVAGWQKNILFIADNIPDAAGDFIALAEGIISDYIDPNPYFQPIRIYEDDGDGIANGYDYGCVLNGSPQCDAATYAITSTVNITGTLVANYIGHASVNRWSGESVFLTSDIPTLNNANQLPVVLSMTCLDGHWTYPNWNSLTYDFLVTPGKGAVATFSATGLGVATGHDSLQRGFFASMMDDGKWDLGSATFSGKFDLWLTGSNYDLLHTFMVFGDPAMGVRNPYKVRLTPPSAAQSGDSGTDVIYNLTVKNIGQDVDSFDILVSQGSWGALPSTFSVGPLNPGQSTPFQVTVSIPPSALGNDSDLTSVTVTSQGDTARSDISQLTTTASTDGLALSPSSQTLFGGQGDDVIFTLTLTNTTVTVDTFNVSISGANWPVSAPSQVGPLPGGASTPFQVTVSIPGGANPGDQDAFTVDVSSQNDPGNVASSSLTAIVSGAIIYLPIVIH